MRKVTTSLSKLDRARIAERVRKLDKLTNDQISELTDLVTYIVATNSTSLAFSKKIPEKLQQAIFKIIDEARSFANESVSEDLVNVELTDTPKEKKKWFLLSSSIGLALAAYVSRAMAQRLLDNKQVDSKEIASESKQAIKNAVSQAVFTAHNGQFQKDVRDAIKKNITDKNQDYFIRWDATLDSVTCSRCRAMHGKTVPISGSFSQSPPLHPHCRCVLTIVTVSK